MSETSWSQEDSLEEALASLTEDDIPPEDAYRDWHDPGTAPPAELAGLDDAELDEVLAAAVPAAPCWRSEPSWPVDSPPSAGPAQPAAVIPAGPAVAAPAVAAPQAVLSQAVLAQAVLAQAVPAGCLPRDGSGGGTGFCDGGVLDVLAAGLPLAGFAEDAHEVLGRVSDDGLIGVLRAWRRVGSWAAARELAAVAELARRRPGKGSPPGAGGRLPLNLSEFLPDEVAAALTLTYGTAVRQTQLALDLAGPLAATAAALAAGWIDLAKARLFAEACGPLTGAHAAAVQAAVLPGAPDLTCGQLRRALAHAVLAADPEAARRQREEAVKEARVDCYPDPAGTATLAGRNLPSAQALAADKRLCRVAKTWKKLGATGGLDLLRARAYLALLLGLDVTVPPADLVAPADAGGGRDDHTSPGGGRGGQPGDGTGAGPGRGAGTGAGRTAGTGAGGPAGPDGSTTGPSDGTTNRGGPASPGGPGSKPAAAGEPVPGGQQIPAGLRPPQLPPLAGSVNLTIPLSTLLHLADRPGEAAGYGPVDPDTARQLACAAAGHRATRWHITVTGPAGRALAHGTATRRRPAARDDDEGWTVSVTAEPIAAGHCDHRNAEPGYRPSPALQRLVRARNTRCTAPGCGRPAVTCDVDHTVPHDQGGITCECNLAPLCRMHHRMKQDEGWTLEQPSPGVMAWLTPAGRRYITIPSQHPT